MYRGVGHKQRHHWAWLGVTAVIVAALIIWYLNRPSTSSNQPNTVVNQTTSNINTSASVNSGTNTKTATSNSESDVQRYTNDTYAFSLSYPVGWDTTTSTTGAGEEQIFSAQFSDPASPASSISVSVMSDTLEGLVRNSIDISGEETITVHGVTGQRLSGGSAKDGSPVDIVILKKGGRLYSVRGTGQEFENIVNSLELT